MNPSQINPFVTENELNIGIQNSIRFTAQVFISLKTEQTNIRNELELELDVADFSVFIGLLAKIESDTLLKISLRHILNYHC